MEKSFPKKIMPLFFLFVVVNAVLLWYQKSLPFYHIDVMVVFAANSLLFVLSVLSLMMHTKAIDKKNPNAAIRGVLGATVLTLCVLAAAALIYLFITDKSRSLNAIFIGMVLYVFYTFIEVRIASKTNQDSNGGN